VIVCGAAGQLGAGIARRLVQAGARVVLHYHRSAERAHRLAAELGLADASVLAADLADPDQAAQLAKGAVTALGRVDGVVNCAHGPAAPRLVADMTWSDWETHLDALRTHVNICSASLPALRASGDGRIVFVSGALAVRFHSGCSAYSTVKAGLEAFSRTLALEEGAHGVKVNIISPGLVREDPTVQPGVDGFSELDRMSRERMALPSEPTTVDVANSALFLLSDLAREITGQTIYLTGGEVMR
jgi:NAD(P)-dependent dehydrogenase (short-subunit alcohol dehydrogenase family)